MVTQEAIYKITTENGNARVWEFKEHHANDTYGNGNYISIVNADELIAYVDMRYIKYHFESFCESYIKQYFGENLLCFRKVLFTT